MRSHLAARAFLLRCRQPPSWLSLHLSKLAQGTFRPFHSTSSLLAIKTQRLTDIGEGNKEVQIIQWYVTEGARVEEWDNLCQVQSDKAADDITARFGGVVKKLYWETDDTVQTGEPLVDIDVVGENGREEIPDQTASEVEVEAGDTQQVSTKGPLYDREGDSREHKGETQGKHSTLATPAVRGLLKEHEINITSIRGTGRDGRVLKEDVHQYLKSREASPSLSTQSQAPPPPSQPPTQTETSVPLSPIQAAMYRSMTASLAIPHFLCTSEVDVTALTAIRQRLNSSSKSTASSGDSPPKLSLLPFIVKALSLALSQYPLLNARLALPPTSSPSQPPTLVLRPSHNIGIAMDTPSGLLVPVLPNAASQSIRSLGSEIARLSALGAAGRLASSDLAGGTITVSNVGSLPGSGATVVAPRIIEGQTAIVGVGRSRGVPAFDDTGSVVRREMVTLSWAADHRVVDGATVARAATTVKKYLEDVGALAVELR